MQDELELRLEAAGHKILTAAQNELYLNMRFLDVALSGFVFEKNDATTRVGTNGFRLFFCPAFLADRYRRSRVEVNRAYLHMVFHCIFRHMLKKEGRDTPLWDLACDIAVESVIDSLPNRSVQLPRRVFREKQYERLRAHLNVLTAEGIYRVLDDLPIPGYEREQLAREFLVCDHGFWTPDQNDDQEEQEDLNRKWQEISEKMQTDLETVSKGTAPGGDAVLEQVRVENRERYDYRAFLKKFAVFREEMKVDTDSFDYVFYTYGLSLYGNMPLIEPQEFREAKRIEDFVIAIDTSMSCSGDLVRAFLRETYAILKGTESFFKRVNIHILQCDDQIRSDQKITSAEELRDYMEQFELSGGAGTDFRPVFAHVDELVRRREFHRLRGLVYFTDGLGPYPKKRPAYDVAFVFLRQGFMDIAVPPWAIKLILEPEDLGLGNGILEETGHEH